MPVNLPKRPAAPPRTLPGRPSPAASAAPPAADDPPELAGAESYMSFGDDAGKRVTEYQQHASRPRTREFFITTKEVTAGNGQATIRVHFAVNYADKRFHIAVPRVTIPSVHAGQFDSFTSPGADCAIAAAGITPSIRPVYVLVDHRQYVTKEGKPGADDVKLWIPQPSILGLVDNAINDLAEVVGCERSKLNLLKYEAKITKVGTGRRSAWNVSIVPKEKSMAPDTLDKINKFFGAEGRAFTYDDYRKRMTAILAPDPKYMISKGGTYVKKATGPTPMPEDGEPPY